MSIPITLRTDFDAAAVRGVAKGTKNAAQGRRLLALAELRGAARMDPIASLSARGYMARFIGRQERPTHDRSGPGG